MPRLTDFKRAGLDGCGLVVLDAYGAAMVRKLHRPADAFTFFAREYGWRYGLPVTGLAGWRRQAERRARVPGRRVALEQIYARMPLSPAACEALLHVEKDVERALAAPHPLGVRAFARARAAGVPVAFVDEGPLDGDTVTRALEHAGYGRVPVFSSVSAAASAHGVAPERMLYFAGEGRRLEASGLGETESLMKGLQALMALRLDAGDERDEAQRAYHVDLATAQRDFPWLPLRPEPRPSERVVTLVQG